MITIKRLEYPDCQLYGPGDEFLGFLYNEWELHSVRVQIKEQSLTGYYIMSEDEQVFIDKNGRLERRVERLFPTGQLLTKLI